MPKKSTKIIEKELYIPPAGMVDDVNDQPVHTQFDMNQRKVLAARDYGDVIIEILKDNRNPILKIVGDNEFKTLVNALTLESEAELIQRVVIYLEELKTGNINGK